MAVQVTINSITGTSPFDIYICQVGGTGCFYMATISTLPYTFNIPSPYNTSSAYMLKIIDDKGCIITGIDDVVPCSQLDCGLSGGTATILDCIISGGTVTILDCSLSGGTAIIYP
jgi:hypothetical protein